MAKSHPFPYLEEILCTHPDYISRRMFGLQATYFGERIVAVCGSGADQPEWNGLLLPVDRERHPEICGQFRQLIPHPVLGKWLYLSELDPEFEGLAESLARLIRKGDMRFGVVAEKKRRKPKKRVEATGNRNRR